MATYIHDLSVLKVEDRIDNNIKLLNKCKCGVVVKASIAKELSHCCGCDSWHITGHVYDQHIQLVHLST